MKRNFPERSVIRPPKLFDPSFHSYSHGVRRGNILFVSGQMSFVKDKRSSHRKLIGKGDIELQARQVFKNIKEVVHEAGASLQDIISMTVYLKDMSDLDRFCKVRQEFFKRDPPTSTAVQISALANPDALVEVNAIAVLPS